MTTESRQYRWTRWRWEGATQFMPWTKWHILSHDGRKTLCGHIHGVLPEPYGQLVDTGEEPPPPKLRCKRCARAHGFSIGRQPR